MSLNVVIKDKTGNPVPGVTVTIHSKVQTTVTDSNGIASFQNVEPGDHRVLLAYNDYKGEEKLNVKGDSTLQTLSLQVNMTNGFNPIPTITIATFLIAIIVFLLVSNYRLRYLRTR